MKRSLSLLAFLATIFCVTSKAQNPPAAAIVSGTSLPATCQPNNRNVFVLISGTSGTPYYCSAPNTWSLWSGGGGGGSPAGPNGSVQYDNSGSFGAFGNWDGSFFSVNVPTAGSEQLTQPQFQSGVMGVWQTDAPGPPAQFVLTVGHAIYTDTGAGCGDPSYCDEVYQNGADMVTPIALGLNYQFTYIVGASSGTSNLNCYAESLGSGSGIVMSVTVGTHTIFGTANSSFFGVSCGSSGAASVDFTSFSLGLYAKYGIGSAGNAVLSSILASGSEALIGDGPIINAVYTYDSSGTAGSNQSAINAKVVLPTGLSVSNYPRALNYELDASAGPISVAGLTGAQFNIDTDDVTIGFPALGIITAYSSFNINGTVTPTAHVSNYYAKGDVDGNIGTLWRFWATQAFGSGSIGTWVQYYADDMQVGQVATNPYYSWFDPDGVLRWRHDCTFNSVCQAIMGDYNPQFTKYTPGAAAYERGVMQWESNVFTITTEAGNGGSTLRNIAIDGAEVDLGSSTHLVKIEATTFKLGTLTCAVVATVLTCT